MFPPAGEQHRPPRALPTAPADRNPEERMATVAKDKSTKPDKNAKSKPGKSKGDGAFAKPSEAPGGGDGWKLADEANIGRLLIFTPLRKQTTVVTRGKKSEDTEVIVADVVVVNEKKPEKSELHEEVFVFPRWIQGALRGYIGERKVLGRLDTDAEKSQGDRPAWVLEDASNADVKIAEAYLKTVDPFDQKPGKSKAKADDAKPAKSGKKSKGK